MGLQRVGHDWVTFMFCFVFFLMENKNHIHDEGRHCFKVGVSNLWDLMPEDLRWSWCNNNRNKEHNKCNRLESSWNRAPHSSLWKNCLPLNQFLVPKSLGSTALKHRLYASYSCILCNLTITPSTLCVIISIAQKMKSFAQKTKSFAQGHITCKLWNGYESQ